jgi:hypothetical protein
MTGNWLTIVALLSWPFIAGMFYRRMPVATATVWTILGAYLLLPSGIAIKFEMIPAFDKSSISNLCALAGCAIVAPRQSRLPTRSRVADALLIVYLVSPIFTSAFNNDNVIVGDRVLPGVGNYDAISAVMNQFLFFLTIFVGRRWLRNSFDTLVILRSLVIAGLLYTIPVLIEIRMSPQLSNWIYGYFTSNYAVEGRYGGFRPVVFLNNGLTLSFFVMTSFLASLVLWRIKIRVRNFRPAGVSAYLAVILILCKSAGALTYGLVAGLIVRAASPRLQMKIAVALVSVGLLYPSLRAADLFPTTTLVNFARLINEDRAASLKYRFDNEDLLLAKASQRYWFGWGRYGRSRVYADDTGNDVSVTDGAWIITLGNFGIVGFLAQFGLLALPVFRAARSIKYLSSKNDALLLAALSLILSLSVIEQIPNASISPWVWLLAGALLGRTELLSSAALANRKQRPASSGVGLGSQLRIG